MPTVSDVIKYAQKTYPAGTSIECALCGSRVNVTLAEIIACVEDERVPRLRFLTVGLIDPFDIYNLTDVFAEAHALKHQALMRYLMAKYCQLPPAEPPQPAEPIPEPVPQPAEPGHVVPAA